MTGKMTSPATTDSPAGTSAATTREEVIAALAAAQEGPPIVARLGDSAVLALSGADARSFLHGQLANDVTGLQPGEVGRSLLLNHKGHAMAEAALLRLDEQILCVVDDGMVDWVVETLERHIVFDDVKMARSPGALLTVQGRGAAGLLTAAGLLSDEQIGAGERPRFEAAGGVEGAAGGFFVYPNKRSAAGGFDVVAEGGDAAAVVLVARLQVVGARVVGEAGLAAARVSATIPTAAAEGGDGVLPQEAGLESLISYRKGCYLGQEIMARIEARGNLRRELALLELDAEPQPHGAAAEGAQRTVLAGERRVGVLGTVTRLPGGEVVALAVLRRDLEPDQELSVAGVGARRRAASVPIMPT